MKSYDGNKKLFSALAFALSLSLMVGSSAPAASASVEELIQFKNNVLDGIENAVMKTGLPDLKTNTWKEHGFLVKPYFKTRYALTSNVLNAPDTDSDHTDNIFQFIPGVQLLYKFDKGVIGAAYEAVFKYFAQFERQNTQDQNALFYANLFPTENTYVRVSDRIEQQGHVAGSSAFKPIDQRDNIVNAVVGYRIPDSPVTLEFGYENLDRDWHNVVAEFYNFNENKVDPRVYYQINENIRAFTGMRFGWIDYENNDSRDTTYWEIPVGIEGELIWGIRGIASIGVHHRNLEHAARNDLTHVVTNIGLERHFNDGQTQVTGGFSRKPVESVFSSATTYDEKLWFMKLRHLITNNLRGRAGIYYGNRDFEERTIVGPRIVVGGRVFAISPISTVKRDDDVFGINLGFDYHVRKWLIFHMDYAYNRRDSNISVLDYTENVFSLGTTIPL